MVVCHNRRIYRNKVFKGIAERGHCSVGFFYFGKNADIKIKILSVKRSSTRIGIEAPKAISVHREEVYQRIQKKSGTSYR